MSASRPRSGIPVVPGQVSAGTDGNLTSPRVYEFATYARPVMIWNNTGNGNPIRVKLNSSDATDFGGGSDDGLGHFVIPDGSSVEVSLGGLLNVKRISFVTTDGGDDLDDVEVHGWQP